MKDSVCSFLPLPWLLLPSILLVDVDEFAMSPSAMIIQLCAHHRNYLFFSTTYSVKSKEEAEAAGKEKREAIMPPVLSETPKGKPIFSSPMILIV